MIFKAYWSTLDIPALRGVHKPWDDWGWAGVAARRVTARVWWIGNGSTAFVILSAWHPWNQAKYRHWSGPRLGVCYVLLGVSLLPVEPFRDSDCGLTVRVWRIEFDLAHYRKAPEAARPDLWGDER